MAPQTEVVWLGWSLYATVSLTLLITLIELRRRRWRWLLLPLLLVIICAIWAFYLMLRWPASTTVQVSQPADQAQQITTQTLEGTYFRFDYLSSWDLDRHDQAGPPHYLERAQLNISQPHPYRWVVSVETPTESFDQIPAIQSRRRNVSGQYTESARVAAGHQGTEFTLTSGGYERTLFWLFGGKLYVASLTSPTVFGDGDALFDQYVASLTFK